MSKWEYNVTNSYNKGNPGDTYETQEHLNEMGQDGWIFCGQISREWDSDATWHTERFDVFRREITAESGRE